MKRTGEAMSGPPAARLSPVEKPAALRCLGPVDAAGLAARAASLSDRAWRREDGIKENRYFCFHSTQHVIFRFIAGNRDPQCFYSEPAWRAWRGWLLPLMAQAVAPYGFAEPVFPKAMLARLAAGRGIDMHMDGGGSHPLVHKIHVPLETDPRAVMTIGGADFHLAAGYAFEVNNLVPHGVFNGGTRDRVHFIFEVFDGAGSIAATA